MDEVSHVRSPGLAAGRRRGERRTLGSVGIGETLEQLPESIVQPPGRLWSVLARSLGEMGAGGRTALAWRWALTGECPSPVILTKPPGRPPGRPGLIAEAQAQAELARADADPGGDVMQARFVLRWLAGEIEALPLWNGGPEKLRVTDGVDYPHARPEIDEVYSWALLAEFRYPRRDQQEAGARLAFGWVRGVIDLLEWVCGETAEGPLSGRRTAGRPSLYEVSLDASRAMTGLIRAREAGDVVRARRRESLMETFLWLAGWARLPPVDRHGHGGFEDCPEREAPCCCHTAGRCVRGDCAACWRVACVYGVGQGGLPAPSAGVG